MKRRHFTPNGIDGKHTRAYRFRPKSAGTKHRTIVKVAGSNSGSYPILSVSSEHLGKVRMARYMKHRVSYSAYPWYKEHMIIGCVNIRL